MKTKNKKTKSKDKKKAPKIKMLTIPARTASSKAIKSLKWKLKEERKSGACAKQGCNKIGVQGLWCKKHRKILRKEQLRLNNIPWRKKVQAGGGKAKYKRDQIHVGYGGNASEFAVANPDLARKRVRKGHSTTFVTMKMLEKALADAKTQMRKLGKKDKVKVSTKPPKTTKATKVKVKASKKIKTKIVKPVKKEKKAASTEEYDFT